jgi:hypothetical protein
LVFEAIAGPTRRAILTLLAIQALTPNAMAEKFDMSRQSSIKTYSHITGMGIAQT